MRWRQLQVVQYFDDVLSDCFEGVFLLPDSLRKVNRLAMSPQVYEQEIEFLLEIPQLLVPNGTTSPCTMDKHYPFAATRMQKLFVV